jgi:hypothetical protein
MIQKQFVHDPVDLPHNWQEVTVQLFIEQFPKPAGAESVESAFRRLAGHTAGNPVHVQDTGSEIVYFFRAGWVKCVAASGGSYVGVLVRP